MMQETSLETARCKIRLVFPRGDVLHFVVDGHIDVEAMQFMISSTEQALERTGRIWIFNDWWEVNGYDSRSRQMLTEKVRSLGDHIAASHILVKSGIVAMGVTVANFFLNQSQTAHSDRGSFEKALEQVLSS